MFGFDMGTWKVKKVKAWTWIPSSGLDTWFMGLSELVTTAPEASACMEIVPPVCKTRIFLGMIYSLFLKCGIIIVSQKGRLG
ncbi:hypothetical protein D063_04040 [Streptococcus pneumoniae 3051]|nr:hypothetical protein D061_10859 [Streptococcus pneumoniae 1488]EOB28220.1 hypothetical protein D063_04040 [Streptococcus pneumoniae 3051]